MSKLLAIAIVLSLTSCGKNPNKDKGREPALVSSKSICGKDDRLPSFDLRVGRGLSSATAGGGCTVTMISKNCAISVGHCRNSINVVEFNVPPSVDSVITHSNIEDTYTLRKGSLVYSDNGIGNDWAVFELAPNAYHGHSAGAMQGYYGLDFQTVPSAQYPIRISGYGLDTEPERNLAQQDTAGQVVRINGSQFFHNVDTMGGNSGSSIISLTNNRIIGVHSHGGCASDANGGTLLSTNFKFQQAIVSCLKRELYVLGR